MQHENLPNVTLVVGPGGAGKSCMVHALERHIHATGCGKLLVTAYTGVAAAPFGGPTLLRLHSLGIYRHNQADDAIDAGVSAEQIIPVLMGRQREEVALNSMFAAQMGIAEKEGRCPLPSVLPRLRAH